MRILTYNVQGWRTIDDRPNVSRVADLLEQTGAEVVGLNEVYHPCPGPAGSALAWLAGRLGMSYAFAACEARRLPETGGPVSFGNALLSRLPLRGACAGLLLAVPDKLPRGYLEARVEAGGKTLMVVVTHLDHTDEAVRVMQLEDLFARAGSGEEAWDVVMGDFNCVHPREYEDRPNALARLAHHPVARHLANAPAGPLVTARVEERGYADAVIHKGQLGKGTFIPAEEPARLDYVWVSTARLPELAGAGVVEEPAGREASDHRPVWAELREPGS
jgi:endonuclease/exonuclease/phosphatase family metal-dependent hydrolase